MEDGNFYRTLPIVWSVGAVSATVNVASSRPFYTVSYSTFHTPSFPWILLHYPHYPQP